MVIVSGAEAMIKQAKGAVTLSLVALVNSNRVSIAALKVVFDVYYILKGKLEFSSI